METKENLHEGHRQRAIEKLMKNPDGLAEHELLEILLFSVLPRQDTNALAHRLLNCFGSLEKVLSATGKELMSVKGVGKSVSAQIIVLGRICNIVSARDKDEDNSSWSSFYSHKKEIACFFNGIMDERFVMVLLDKRRRKITKITCDNEMISNVKVDVPDLAKAIAIHKPAHIVICHNHPSGNPLPSEQDDFTTKKINLVCAMHGVTLADHVIFAGNDRFYSYHVENRLDDIKKIANLDKLITAIKE